MIPSRQKRLPASDMAKRMTVGRWTESRAGMRRSAAVREATRKNYEGFLTTFGMTVGEECGGKSPSLQMRRTRRGVVSQKDL